MYWGASPLKGYERRGSVAGPGARVEISREQESA